MWVNVGTNEYVRVGMSYVWVRVSTCGYVRVREGTCNIISESAGVKSNG